MNRISKRFGHRCTQMDADLRLDFKLQIAHETGRMRLTPVSHGFAASGKQICELQSLLRITMFLLKTVPPRGAECAGTGSDHYSARNLRQRLSPKAKPWDNGNTDQGKRQALSRIEGLVASLERVVMLIPSHSFLLSCESCKSCQNVFSASFRALRETVLICVHPCPNILCELRVSARNIFSCFPNLVLSW
jgi:hypothetical protein